MSDVQTYFHRAACSARAGNAPDNFALENKLISNEHSFPLWCIVFKGNTAAIDNDNISTIEYVTSENTES